MLISDNQNILFVRNLIFMFRETPFNFMFTAFM